MNAERLVSALERFGRLLPAVLADIPDSDLRWKPADGAWSILEVLRHLGDEEVDDFRRRLRLTLEDVTASWPAIDPPGWAVERRYNESDPLEAQQRFVSERQDSVAWLRGLQQPDWSATYRHPKLGAIRAGDLLAAWTAHDQLHLRQIAKRLYQMAQRDAEGYTTDYAGTWSA